MHDVLPVCYFHLVFTLPHELNGWAQLHPELIYHLLFQCAWHTLDDYSHQNKQLQGQLGMIGVLHSWGQNLNQHIHLHCLIPGCAITENNCKTSRREYLYPHKALGKLFRGKMVSGLRKAYKKGQLKRIKQPGEVDKILNNLMGKDWVIYTKPHINKAETVVRYLGRYTHRTAISLSRIESVTKTSVQFKWLDYRDSQQKIMTLPGTEFLRRYLLHILPKGFMRIRHYGYMANRVRVKQLEKIRDWLNEPTQQKQIQKNPRTGQNQNNTVQAEDKTERCPGCKKGILQRVAEILSEKQRRQSKRLMC